MTVKKTYYQMLVSPKIGGAAKLALEIHEQTFIEHGPVSSVLVPKGGDAEELLRARSIPLIQYSLDRLVAPRGIRALFENAYLSVVLPSFRSSSVLHVHSPFVYGALRPMFSVSRVKRVLHIHLDYSSEQLTWPLQQPPDLILLSAKSIAPAVEEALPKHAQCRIRVLQNAVDTSLFKRADKHAAKNRLNLDSSSYLSVMIANLAPHKGHETAIRAFSEIPRGPVAAKLWIVGEERDARDQFTEKLKTLVRDLKLEDRVEFLGFRQDIPEILQAADSLLLPSTSETLSLVILEAQASGAVVLAAPTADIPEVVHDNETGYLIAADDYRTYAARLSMLMDDARLARRLADNAHKQIVTNFRMDSYRQAVMDEYENLT